MIKLLVAAWPIYPSTRQGLRKVHVLGWAFEVYKVSMGPVKSSLKEL